MIGRHQPNTDLQILRQSNPSSEREKLIAGLFDRRMRQLAKLDSKQEILMECQKILIQKVLDYMNQLDLSDLKYLQMADQYSQKLQSKEESNRKLQKSLDITRIELKGKIEEVDRLVKQIKEMKIKIQHLQSQNEGLISQQKNDETQLQTNKKLIKDLEQSNFAHKQKNKLLQEQSEYLNQQLQARIEQTKQLNIRLKSQGLKYWNDNWGKDEQMQNIKRKLNKEIHNKEKEIETLQRRVSVIQNNQSTLLETLSSIKNKTLSKFKITPITITLQNKKKKSRVSLKNQCLSPTQHRGSIRTHQNDIESKNIIDESIKSNEEFNFISAPPLEAWTKYLVGSKAVVHDKSKQQSSREIYSKDKNRESFKQVSKQQKLWKSKFKKQFVNAFSDLYKLSTDIKNIANERINIAITQKNQIQQVFAQRPSRQEDIQKIQNLMQINQKLALSQKQAQERAQSAYRAMTVCKQQLKRVLQNTPFQVLNSLQTPGEPKTDVRQIHSKRPGTATNLRRVDSAAQLRGPLPGANPTSSGSRKYKKLSDWSVRHDDNGSLSSCYRDILGPNEANLNKYMKYSNSSMSLSRQQRAKGVKSGMIRT